MRKSDVHISQTYIAKVSDKLTVVVIERAHPAGGWEATNVATHRAVRIRTAGRLRGAATVAERREALQARDRRWGLTPGAYEGLGVVA